MPRQDVEKLLAIALNKELVDDAELRRLLLELPPWTRWYRKHRYIAAAYKSRRVQEVAEAQLNAMRSTKKLAETTLELEREKRRD